MLVFCALLRLHAEPMCKVDHLCVVSQDLAVERVHSTRVGVFEQQTHEGGPHAARLPGICNNDRELATGSASVLPVAGNTDHLLIGRFANQSNKCHVMIVVNVHKLV